MDESPVWRISHGQATCQRRTLATHRTALASTQASSLPVPRRKPLDYRKVLTGIIFVLKTGIPWEQLPQEMGCGCGVTCLNYLNAWQRAGVWEKLHRSSWPSSSRPTSSLGPARVVAYVWGGQTARAT